MSVFRCGFLTLVLAAVIALPLTARSEEAEPAEIEIHPGWNFFAGNGQLVSEFHEQNRCVTWLWAFTPHWNAVWWLAVYEPLPDARLELGRVHWAWCEAES